MNPILVIISQHQFSTGANPQSKDFKVFWAEIFFPQNQDLVEILITCHLADAFYLK